MGHLCRNSVVAFALAVTSQIWQPPASAQSIDPAVAADAVLRKGFHSDRSYFSPLPFEHFDPATGNLLLSFVDLELPGNGGSSIRFQRVYSAQLPEIGKSKWTFGIAGMVMKVKDVPLVPDTYNFNLSVGEMMLTTPLFYMADGGIHRTLYRSQPSATWIPSQLDVTSAGFIRYNRETGTMRYPVYGSYQPGWC